MALRPTHDERKRGDTPGFPLYCPPERIQQACPLFFAALQPRFSPLWGRPPGLRLTSWSASFRPTNDNEKPPVTTAHLPVEQIRHLVHLLPFHRGAFWMGFRQPGSAQVVTPIDRTRLITLANERDEVRQSGPLVATPLRSVRQDKPG